MEDLNNVPSTGTFGNSMNQVNQNFGLVKGAIENVEGRTIRSKGLFPTQAALTAAYPSPKVGDYAYVGSGLPATIYDCLVEGTWHNTGQTGGSETIDLGAYSTTAQMNTAIDNGLQGQVGYAVCNSNGSDRKDVVVNGFKLLASGGALHIKMTNVNTSANATMNISPTSTIVSANTKPLFYNGAQASPTNTWAANEIISVYYDGTNYQATNSQGGGGKAEKIKYNNTQSGLTATDVQGAVDEVCDNLNDELYNHTSLDVSYGGDYSWIIGTINPDNGRAYSSSSYHHINIPVEAGMRMKITANQNTYTQYTFLKDINFSYAGSSGTDISSHYCAGYNNVIRIDAGESAAFTIPDDCNYLYVACGQTSGDVRAPESVVVYSPKLDITQEAGQSTEKVMSQKAVTDELVVLGGNLIDMSVKNVDTGSTTYLTATKNVENNGVQFTVVAHQTSKFTQGRIYPINLVAGKTYRLSFEYINTAYESIITTRDSSGDYVLCPSLETKHVPIKTVYNEYINDFVAPEGAVYYLAFMNLTQGSANSSLTIRNFSLVDVSSLKDKVSEIDDEIEQLQEDVENIDNIKTEEFDIPVISDGKYVSAVNGGFVSATGGCHSDFLPTYGASKISVYAPPLGSSSLGIAFYGRTATASFITPADSSVYIFSHRDGWKWITYDVPEGATKFRVSLLRNTPSQYCLVTPLNYLQDIFLKGVEDMIATQIFRSAKMVSETKYKCAFPVQQVVIIDGKAYITYFGSETKYDDDALGRPYSVLCRAVVNLGDMSHATEYPTVGTTQYADGTTANPVKIGYVTECPTPNNSIAKFGLMRFNNKNPYYCWAIEAADVTVNNWKTCRLSYNNTTVDFTVNNYRQMLVDMGYTPTYIASTADAVDNINIHYDKTEGIYYAVLCHANSAFPLVMMQSTDLATWSPRANLGTSYTANEIEAIYKNGIAYVAWRTASSQMRWRIYDVANSTLLGEGVFPGTKEILSKPDVFTFNGNVYMAVNVNPSVYGEMSGVKVYTADARSQIAIYKVIGNTIKLFRQVCNPTGINYFSFMEINENYPAEVSQAPVIGQGSIYIAFSEDRRHFYRRQLAQISFADVTALFADFDRIV